MTPAVILAGLQLMLYQVLAALPWLVALDPLLARTLARQSKTWINLALTVVVGGVALGIFMNVVQDPQWLVFWGRVYGVFLNAQLILDLFVAVFGVLLWVWPRGAAVGYAAFREGIRQPMFLLLGAVGLGMMAFSPFIPYFTFGEDFKMVKELGYDWIMLFAAAFAVLEASRSISEEIEGRTAVTLMSKPVSRREFLLGKFLGILSSALFMSAFLGLFFCLLLWFTPNYINEPVPEPGWLNEARVQGAQAGSAEVPLNFSLGMQLWFSNALEASPGIIMGFGQVMVLTSIAVALATRLPMIVNIMVSLVIFFLGHLAPVLVEASQTKFKLVGFVAQVFDYALPGLKSFDLGPVVTRDIPPETWDFTKYVGATTGYALMYTAIALFLGLFLFEDRDLA